MLSLITSALGPGCKLHTYNFTALPDQNCWECNKCGALFSSDELRARLVHLRKCPDVHVYCCTRPVLSINDVMVNAKMLFRGNRTSEVPEHLPGEPGFEHEVERAVPVCRWCKGTGKITINFKTKPCDCVKGEGTVGPFAGTDDIGRGWKVKKTFAVWVKDNRSPPMAH